MTAQVFRKVKRRLRSNQRRKLFGSKAGTDPGKLEVGSGRPTQISVYRFLPAGLEKHAEVDTADLPNLLKGSHPVWIDIHGLGDVEKLESIRSILGFHQLYLEDVTNAPQQPKAEQYRDDLLMVSRYVTWNEELETEQVSLLLNQDRLVTFREGFFAEIGEFMKKLAQQQEKTVRQQGTGYLAYRMLDYSVDSYVPVLHKMDRRLQELEASVVYHQDEGSITEIYQQKLRIMDIRRTLYPHRELISALETIAPDFMGEGSNIHIRDIRDHVSQLAEEVEYCRETSANLMSLHLSIAGTRMNEIMKVLAVMAAIFVPLTFIAGLYGMNFNTEASPWNMPELNAYYGYPACLALMLAIALGLFIYFRKSGWIR